VLDGRLHGGGEVDASTEAGLVGEQGQHETDELRCNTEICG